MNNMIHLIGDMGNCKRIDSSLVDKLNREAELEAKLGGKNKKTNEAVVDSENKQDNQAPDLNLRGFFYVPSNGIYLAKARSFNSLSWNNAIKEIYEKGVDIEGHQAEMPTPFEFMSGLIYVLDNENIQDLPANERAEFLDDILKTGNYRGNHLNARFGEDFIETAEIENGKLVWKKSSIEQCLPKNCYADIRKINSQGLFTTESASQSYAKEENAYFWKPVSGYVAGFVAGSGWADLSCGRDPVVSVASLGVRLVVRPKGDAQNLGGSK